MQTATVSRSRGVWPLAAICCLGLILFLIAAAIVIALIPVYLPSKNVAVASPDNSPFYLTYSAPATADSGLAGTIGNPAGVGTGLGLPGSITVKDGRTATNGVDARRKRGLLSRRKRAITITILLTCQHQIVSTCDLKCKNDRAKVIAKIKKSTTFSNVQISINYFAGTLVSYYNLAFIGLFTTLPPGFPTPPTSSVFIAIRSGSFDDASIWAGGIVPFGPCDVVISTGITVTISRASLGIKVKTITIYGVLALGAGSSTFTFKNPISIVVRSGGKIEDDTTNKQLLVPRSSIITIFTGGSFSAAGTTIQTYSSAGLGSSFIVTIPNGPFTFAVLPSGLIVSFYKVTFIAIQSGPFTSGSTYLGGIAPSVADCAASGCGVYIAPGVTLSTVDLNGVLNIRIDVITVAIGATFQLGTPGSSSGFKFLYPVELDVFGVLAFVASGGGIFLPPGSAFNLYGGASFVSVVVTFLQVYDPTTGILIGVALTLDPSILSIPYFVAISITGTISISNTPPGVTGGTPVASSTQSASPGLF